MGHRQEVYFDSGQFCRWKVEERLVGSSQTESEEVSEQRKFLIGEQKSNQS